MRRIISLACLLFIFYTNCNVQNKQNSVPDNKDIFTITDTSYSKSDSNQFYFPLEFFVKNYGVDTFIVRWYSKDLFALKEPVIFKDGTDNEIFRFTWLRTFNNPIAIRIEKHTDSYMLFWKLCNGKGGYDPGKLIVDKQKNIDKEQWDEFKRKLDIIDFWKMPTEDKRMGFDGAEWILEGKINNKYHVVNRWCPIDTSEYYKCCDYLLGLTDLYIDKEVKY